MDKGLCGSSLANASCRYSCGTDGDGTLRCGAPERKHLACQYADHFGGEHRAMREHGIVAVIVQPIEYEERKS